MQMKRHLVAAPALIPTARSGPRSRASAWVGVVLGCTSILFGAAIVPACSSTTGGSVASGGAAAGTTGSSGQTGAGGTPAETGGSGGTGTVTGGRP